MGGRGMGDSGDRPPGVLQETPSRIPTKFKEPDAGVVDGESISFYDYKKQHPDWLEKVEADAKEFRANLTLDAVNEKLPGI